MDEIEHAALAAIAEELSELPPNASLRAPAVAETPPTLASEEPDHGRIRCLPPPHSASVPVRRRGVQHSRKVWESASRRELLVVVRAALDTVPR